MGSTSTSDSCKNTKQGRLLRNYIHQRCLVVHKNRRCTNKVAQPSVVTLSQTLAAKLRAKLGRRDAVQQNDVMKTMMQQDDVQQN